MIAHILHVRYTGVRYFRDQGEDVSKEGEEAEMGVGESSSCVIVVKSNKNRDQSTIRVTYLLLRHSPAKTLAHFVLSSPSSPSHHPPPHLHPHHLQPPAPS